MLIHITHSCGHTALCRIKGPDKHVATQARAARRCWDCEHGIDPANLPLPPESRPCPRCGDYLDDDDWCGVCGHHMDTDGMAYDPWSPHHRYDPQVVDGLIADAFGRVLKPL